MSIRRTNAPLELLQIYFLLNLAHDCHVWLGDDQVRCSFEAKFLIDRHDLVGEDHLHEESRILIGVNCSNIFIEVNEIFELREQLAV